MSQISEALRLIRVFHDVKQRDLSIALGISTSYLSEIERGRKQPSIEIIQKYSDEFRIPISSILFFSEQLCAELDKSSHTNMQGVISGKIIAFLQFIETRTSDHD